MSPPDDSTPTAPRDTYEMQNALYISPPVLIGKHEWCCVVFRHAAHGACTDYHWRRTWPKPITASLGADRWQSQAKWPRWDSNDPYEGLPRRLSKLHARHRQAIEAALQAGRGGPR